MKTPYNSFPQTLAVRTLPLLIALAFNPALAGGIAGNALPGGGQIVAGQGQLQQAGNTLNVLQNSQQLITNWQTFNIGQQGTVNFIQPNASAMALNRVIGADPSQIFGKLNANGQVLLINPNGVLFGQGAQINVGALMASTQALSNEDFLSGKFKLTGGTAGVSNAGDIRTNADGGYVLLSGATVDNSGTVRADGGTAALVAGRDVSVTLGQSGLLKVKIDTAAAQASINNSGAIIADGGQVLLAASQAAPLVGVAINQSGIIRANTVNQKQGEIWLDGGNGAVVLAGRTEAQGVTAGKGGNIVATGDSVTVSGSVDASGHDGGGSVLLGGGWQGRDSRIAEAARVDIAQDASVRADATVSGDGGTVVAWSSQQTNMAGSISARGAGGHDGGQVETSSRKQLGVSGSVDAGSSGGKGGRWLLDPTDLEVIAGSGVPPTDKIYGSSIEASLNAGTEVDLQADHDLTISTDISKTAGGDTSLKLQAGNNILLDTGSDISSTLGKLNVDFGSATLTGGTATLKGTVNSNGGNVTFYKEAVLAHGTPISTKVTEISSAASGNITFNKDVQLAAQGYAVSLNAQGAQSGGVYTGNGGNIIFNGSVSSAKPDVVQLSPQALSIDTTGLVAGDIVLGTQQSNSVGGIGNAALRSLTLAGDSNIAVNAGTINLLNTSGDVLTASNIVNTTTVLTLGNDTVINVGGGSVPGLTSGYTDYRQQTFNIAGVGKNLTINADRSIKIKNTAIDVHALTLNAYAATAAGGGSVLLDNASLQTRGGNLTIGSAANGYATGFGADPDGMTDGVRISNSVINTNNGNLLINGRAPISTSAGAGVKIAGAATDISTGSGDLTINGVVNNQAGSGNKDGVVIGEDGASRATIRTTSGDLTITGDASGVGNQVTGGTRYDGLIVSSKALIKTDSGDIRLTGKGGGGSHSFLTENHGVRLEDTETSILSGSGDITVSGTSGGKTSATGGENSFGIYAKGQTMYMGSSAIEGVSASGVITTEADSMFFVNSSSYHLNVASSGELRVRPLSADRNIEIGTPGAVDKLYLGNNWFNGSDIAIFRPGFGSGNAAQPGITIGRSDATGQLTVASATTLRDNTTLLMGGAGGKVLVNAALTVKASDSSTRQLVLDVKGGATGNGVINTNTLLLLGSGDVVLGGGNLVDTLSANLSDRLDFNNAKQLTIGQGSYVRTNDPLGVKTANTTTTTATDGVVTSNDAVNITLSAGDLLLQRDINAGTATVALAAQAGGISEQASAIVSADKLYLSSLNSSTLDNANQINTLAANVSGSGSDLKFTNAKALDFNRVAVTPLSSDSTATVTAGSVQNHDGVSVNNMARISVSSGDLTQSATQGQGRVTAGSLKLSMGNGNVTLGDSSNQIGTLAANLAAAGKQITVANIGALKVGSVDGMNGVTTNNGDVTLSASADATSVSGDLQLEQGINAGTADVHLSAAKGGINETAATGIITGNELKLTAQNTSTLDSDNAVDEVTASISGSSQGMSLTNTRSLIVGDLDNQTGISAGGNVRLKLANTDASIRNLTQTQDIKAGGLQVASDTGDVTLERISNEIGKLSARLDGSGKALKLKDKDGIEVATVYGQTGIQTNGGDVNLVAAAGSAAGNLTVTDQINTGGSNGVLRLSSLQSAVTGSGKLTGKQLLAQAVSGVNLNNKLNHVETVAGSVSGSGSFLYKNIDTLEVGTVNAADGSPVSGISTNSGNIQLSVAEDNTATGGDLNLTQSLSAGGAGKNMALQAYKGRVTETSNVSLTADQLQLLARDTTELTNPATGSGQHHIGTVAASVTGSNQNLTFFNNDALIVGSVTAEDSVTPMAGVSTASGGKIALATGDGALTLLNNVSAGGTGSVDLRAGGNSGDLQFNGGAASSGSGNVQLIAGRDISTSTNNNSVNEVATTGNVLIKAGGKVGADGKRIEIADAAVLAARSGGELWLNKTRLTQGNLSVGTVTANSYNSGSSFGGSSSDLSGIDAGSHVALSVADGELDINQNIAADNNGHIDLRTGGSNHDIVFGSNAAVISHNGLAAGNGQIQLLSSGSVLAQSADGSNDEIRSNGNLLINAAGSVGSSGNRIETSGINTVAVQSGGAQWLRQNSGDLIVGSVSALTPGDNSLTRTAANLSGLSTTSGDSDIHLNVNAGQLIVDKNVSASNRGAVDLRSRDAMGVRSGASVASASGNLLFSTGSTFSATDSSQGVQTLSTAGGTLVIEANGAINLAQGKIDTSGSAGKNGGEIYLHNTGGNSGDITLGQDVLSRGGSNGNGGVISVRNDNGSIQLNGLVNVSRGSGSTTDGAIQLQASGDILDSASGLLMGDDSGELSARSSGGRIALTGANNGGHLMYKVALSNAANLDGNSISYRDKTALLVGTAGGKGSALAGPAAAPASQLAAVTGISSTGSSASVNGNNILLVNGGDLTIADVITAKSSYGNGGNITVQSSGSINSTAAIIASDLGEGSGTHGGNIVIERTGGSAGSIVLGANVSSNGDQGGNITVHNVNGDITANSALQANGVAQGGTIQLQAAAGKLALNGALQANGANGGTIQLNSSGDITQTSALQAYGNGMGQLKINSGGAVTLNQAGNRVDILAASLSGSGKALSYRNADKLTIGQIAALNGEALTSGISSNGGAISVQTLGNDLTVANTVASSGGAVSLQSAQDVLLNADLASSGGQTSISAGRDLLQGAGNVLAGAGKVVVTVTGKAAQQGVGRIDASQLALRAGTSSSLTAANHVGTVAANVSAGGLALRNATAVTVGSVDGLNGIHTSGDQSLHVDSGDINVAQAMSTDNGTLTLLGDSGNININAGLASHGGKNLTVTATNGAIAMNANVSAAGAVASLVAGGSNGQLTMLGNLSADTVLMDAGRDIVMQGNLTATGAQLRATRDIVQQGGTLSTGSSSLVAGGNVSMEGSANRAGILAGHSGGNFIYRDSADLHIGTAGANQGISSNGRFWLRAKGNVTLDKGVSAAASGNALVLVSDQRLYNNAGASALSAPNGRWLAYDVNPLLSDDLGGLKYSFRRLNTPYDRYPEGSVVEQGNGYLTTAVVGFTEQFVRANGGGTGVGNSSIALPGGVRDVPGLGGAAPRTGDLLQPVIAKQSFSGVRAGTPAAGIYQPLQLPVQPGRDFVAILGDLVPGAQVEQIGMADGSALPPWMYIDMATQKIYGRLPLTQTTPVVLHLRATDPNSADLRLFELVLQSRSKLLAVN